jgi:hypothetical protein
LPTLTDSEASMLVRMVTDRLEEIDARDVIAGIDESRRLGIEEPVEDSSERKFGWSRADLKQLGTVRRRPPTNLEMLQLVFERLRQRLLIVPAIARVLERELKTSDVSWRVDSEFVSSERSPSLEASRDELLPEGADDVAAAYELVREMIPEIVPGGGRHG